jgi:hypothetical protein
MQWVLYWVGGPTATWVREALQNAYSILTICESSLLVFFVHMLHRTLSTAMTC